MSEHKVYEFIEGGTAGTPPCSLGAAFMPNDEDASSFGRIFGQLHAAPAEWYTPFANKPKGQWEDFFAGIETDSEAAELRAEFGDVASMVCLFSRTAPENFRAVAMQLSRLLHMQLEPASLLGRLVVGHGDAHGKNLMHRRSGGHGDLVLIDLDFVGRYPAAYDLGSALASTDRRRMPYPTVEQRRLVAQAYLSELGTVVDHFSRSTVEDILFDMEIGSLLREIWIAAVMYMRDTPKRWLWEVLWLCRSGLNRVEAAKTGQPTNDIIYTYVCVCVQMMQLLCEQMPL